MPFEFPNHLFQRRLGARGCLKNRTKNCFSTWERRGLRGGEVLESRTPMAADLAVSFNDNLVPEIECTYYSPGSQVIYTLTIGNNGDAPAASAAVTTLLSSAITQDTWTAAYAGGATGALVGAGNINTAINLPAGSKATFSIVSRISPSATGPLVSTASVTTVSGEVNTANNSATDTDLFAPQSIAVSSGTNYGSTSLVRLVNPTTGSAVASAYAYETQFNTGVRTALAQLDGSGKAHLVCVPNYNRVAELVVFRQDISAGGQVTLVKDSRFSVSPFGAAYRNGMHVAVGDFDGNGLEDIAFAKSSGDGAIRIYTSTPTSLSGPLALFRSFTPFTSSFGGAAIAAGDFGTFPSASSPSRAVDALRQDGVSELVVTSGAGMAPVARMYNTALATPSVIDTITPFGGTRMRGGMTVAVAPVTADSIPDIIFAAGNGGGSFVEIYNGSVAAAANVRLARFAAFADLATRNCSVFAVGVDTDGDGRVNSIDVVQGVASQSALRRYSTTGVLQGTTASAVGSLQLAALAIANDVSLVATGTGLKYKVLVEGTGAKPISPTARVTVDYEGWLMNGTRFDGNNGSAFSLNGVIAGWTEGLQLMTVGSVYQFVIPADLAYGSAGTSGIPPNSPLVFRVKLLTAT